MPVRSYKDSAFYTSIISVLALVYLLAYQYPLFKILSGVVEEKELKVSYALD
jgi:hypothetical protein